MAGILDQAGLSQAPQAGLTPTPQSTVSAGELVGPMRAIGEALGADSQALDEASVPYMQQAGQQAAVTRDADGKINVSEKFLPFATSAGARAYNAALMQGAAAAGLNDVTTQMAQLASAHIGDPAGFKKNADAFISTLGSTGEPMLRPILVQDAGKIANEHFDHLTQQASMAGLTASRSSMLTRVQSLSESLYGLAQGGGLNTDAGQRLSAQIRDQYQALTKNPMFGVNQDAADAGVKSILQEANAYALAGSADTEWKKGGDAAIDALKKNITDNPDSTIPMSERTRIASAVDARVQFIKGENRNQVATALETTNGILEAWQKNRPVDSTMLDDHIAKLRGLGATDQVAALETRRLFAPYLATQANTSDGARLAVNGSNVPPAPVASAINTAAQKYGLDPALMTKMAQIESRFDPNATNPSGASGVFQMMPKTWAQYGQGANVFDPAANADAAARLLVANRDTLASGLGRQPTPGEIYLAHQQGAQGALNLLKNPNASAASVVGSQAVLGNGGTPGMTAGQFATLWTRRFDNAGAPPISVSNSGPVNPISTAATTGSLSGTTTPVLGASGSLPFSPKQAAENSHYLPQYLGAALADQDGQVKLASSMADTILSAMKDRTPDGLPSAQNLGLVMNVAQKYSDAGLNAKVGQIQNSLQGYDLASRAWSMTPTAGAALVAKAKQVAAGNPMAEAAAREAESYYSAGVSRMQSDWVHEAVTRKWVDQPPTFDLSTPATIGQTVQSYGKVATAIAANEHDDNRQLFPPNELAQIKSVATGGPLDQRMALLQGLSSLPDGIRNATLQQIGASGDAAVFAYAGGLSQVAPDIASSLVQGQAAIQTDKRYLPAEGQDRKNFQTGKDTALPPTAFPPTARMAPGGPVQTLNDAVDARVAYLAAQAGDITGKYNETRLKQAVADVTGGMLTQNGAPVIAPARGMDQRTFDAVMSGIKDQDLAGASTGNGTPIPADFLRNSAKLLATGDGRYLVQLNADPDRPMFAQDTNQPARPDGTRAPFVLDLRGRQPDYSGINAVLGAIREAPRPGDIQ